MSTRQETVDDILARLDGLNVHAKAMFGEYGIYCDDKMFGSIADDTLYVKMLPENADHAADLPTGPVYPGSKDHYIVPNGRIDDTQWLHEFVQLTADSITAKKK